VLDLFAYVSIVRLTTLLQCFNTSGWVIRPVKTMSPKWPILCRAGR